jgi:hypothetical protein
MNTTLDNAPEREEIEQLLPWHAVGTLSRRDAARVEEALKRDADLARQYELVREELSETIVLNETLGAPSARAMQKLFAGIEAESGPAREVKPRFSFAQWVSERLSTLSPRTLAYSATAAALAIALQFGLLTGVAVNTALKPEGGFQTASGPETAGAGRGAFALISFKPEATIADINSFLETHRLTLVDGPRAGGMFRVRIADAPLAQGEAEQTLARLRQDASVRFVAPAP